MTEVETRETRRLAALHRFGVMDTPREAAFDEIAALIAEICETPIAVVNLVGEGRQFFKAEVGLGVDSLPLASSFCLHTLLEQDFLLVPDATKDARFARNPHVVDDPNIRFYAGALLKSEEGLSIGTLCVLDYRPRDLTDIQQRAIKVLARQVMAQLEQRRVIRHAASSEARQRAIVDSAIDFAIVATDLDGTIIEWSLGADRVLGWAEHEAIGADAALFFTPEDRAADVPRQEMLCAKRDGRSNDERWHLKKNYERFWASGEMSPLRDEADEHIGYVKILRDRTEQYIATKALEEAQGNLRRAEEAGGVGLFHVGSDGILHATPEFCRLYGVDECLSAPARVFEQLVILEDQALISDRHTRATGTAPLDVEYRIRRADTGELRWIARKGEIERNESGAPIRFAGVARDVTERRLASDALLASEALAHENIERVQLALAAGAIIGTWVWDLSADRFTVDQGFADAFGIEPASGRDGLNLKQVVDMVHPDDQEALMTAINDAVERGGPYAHQYRVRGSRGRYRWIEANGRVDQAADGLPARFPGVILDVDDRREIEAERDRAASALRALNETLEERVAERTAELMVAEEQLRQAQKMEAVGQLTGGIAHDFNNMLTGVIGGLTLVQRDIARGRMDRIDRYIDAVTTSAQRAAALTARLLAFGRRQSLDLKSIDVNSLVNGMEDLLRRTLGEQVVLECDLSPAVARVRTDGNQLESALLNLCINARDAMPDGGSLIIETASAFLDERYARQHAEVEPGNYVAVSVTDTGAGMDAATIAKVFEPFFTTKPVGQGTGLGLSMVYGFLRQSGGHVQIYSESNQGTTVRLYLPCFSGEGEVTVEPALEIARGSGEMVMIVEDDPSVRMIVVEVLEELGYGVIEAIDARTAIPILESARQVDLLVTDVGLPGMNGRQLAEVARQSRPELKILFITGYAESAVVRDGFLDEGMEMLTKPFAVEILAAKLRDIITN